MSPSGLIFLVIVGIWAAYFTQYWIRRREHLSTARSMDRFSESMRVLTRRSPFPDSSLTAPAAASYAVTPARATRPQILHERADVSSAGTVSRDEGAAPRPTGAFVSPGAGGPSADAMLGSSSGRRGERGAVAARGRGGRLRPVRAVLGLTLLAALVATVVVAALAPFTRLLWWAFVVPLLVAVVAAAGLRAVASLARRQDRADRSRSFSMPVRRATANRPADAETSAPQWRTPHAGPDSPTPVEIGDETTDETDETADGAPDDEGAGGCMPADQVRADRDAVHDQDAPAAALAGVARAGRTGAAEVAPVPLVDEDDIPLTWDPVPVPRPTYTMKARAEYPAPPADVSFAGAAGSHAYEDDDDVVDPRRVAGA